jgi:cysteine desulfurase/selenocysteine lyase
MHRYRSQFPILGREVRGKPLAYLDNAATTLKPLEVVKAVEDYYSLNTANIHRGVHFLSEQATEAFEGTRQTVADFLGGRTSPGSCFYRGDHCVDQPRGS